MCGINGIVNLNREDILSLSELKKMTDIIFHRGPDDEGFYLNRNVGLGFRRLSIIDLKTGHQPVVNETNSVIVVLNGEIYNYLEQRDTLIKKGYIFRTTSDTEVLLHLYEEFGTNCLEYLRGMFAFAIWDDNKKQLFCGRDRFGIKPFYYYLDGKKFVFGSEIKTILNANGIDNSLSYDGLDSYFAFGYISGDLSIYENIRKLQPGHFLTLSLTDKASFEIKRYYNIDFEPDYTKSEKYWIEEIEDCLSETVKLHMISDVPLGAFLSGGIDSSAVVAMMAKNSSQPVKTFSIGFRGQEDNEFRYARELAKRYGCEYYEDLIDPESIDLLPKLIKAYDEPFADPSAIPTYYVSKFAREYVTVALSGDGGDEIFAGYDIFRYLKKVHKYSTSFPLFNQGVWGSINKIIPQKVAGKGLTYFLSKEREYLGAYLCCWTKEERKKLMLDNQHDINYSRGSELYKKEILINEGRKDFISNLQNLTIRTYMVDDILTKVDRASMLNSLEVRVPLLDHKFVELSLRIPWYLKLKGNEQKYIFKQAMEAYLPASVLNHFKQGFGIPLAVWFKGDLKEYINDTLLTQNTLLSTYLNPRYVRKIVEDHHGGTRDLSARIWSLLIFEEWLKMNQSGKSFPTIDTNVKTSSK